MVNVGRRCGGGRVCRAFWCYTEASHSMTTKGLPQSRKGPLWRFFTYLGEGDEILVGLQHQDHRTAILVPWYFWHCRQYRIGLLCYVPILLTTHYFFVSAVFFILSYSFPPSVVLFDIFTNMLIHNLSEPAYEADVAQLGYEVLAKEHGLVIRVKGFNHKLPVSSLPLLI